VAPDSAGLAAATERLRNYLRERGVHCAEGQSEKAHGAQCSSNDPATLSAQYPALLLLTGDHDDRVVPLHSYKFIAEIQHRLGKLPEQKNPLLIRVDTKSGHGMGKPTTKIIEETADIYSFVSRALHLQWLGD
jgi:hypothetical protein